MPFNLHDDESCFTKRTALLEDCEGTALVPELLGAWEIASTDVNASMLVEIGMNVGKVRYI